jgi:hypothetical protein
MLFHRWILSGWFRADPPDEVVGLDNSYHGALKALLASEDQEVTCCEEDSRTTQLVAYILVKEPTEDTIRECLKRKKKKVMTVSLDDVITVFYFLI